MKTWKNTLRNAKVVLMHQLKEKDKAIYSELHKEIFTDITKSLDDFLEISDICDLAQFLIEEENKLFDPRITKFVKVSKHHVTSQKKQSTKQPETVVPSMQNTSLSNDKTLLNILEGLLADNIEPQQPINLQFSQSLSERSNSQLKSSTNGKRKERMEGKFVSKNVLNLSNGVLTVKVK